MSLPTRSRKARRSACRVPSRRRRAHHCGLWPDPALRDRTRKLPPPRRRGSLRRRHGPRSGFRSTPAAAVADSTDSAATSAFAFAHRTGALLGWRPGDHGRRRGRAAPIVPGAATRDGSLGIDVVTASDPQRQSVAASETPDYSATLFARPAVVARAAPARGRGRRPVHSDHRTPRPSLVTFSPSSRSSEAVASLRDSTAAGHAACVAYRRGPLLRASGVRRSPADHAARNKLDRQPRIGRSRARMVAS